LELAGFGSSASERKAFDDFVNGHRHDPRNDALSGRNIPRLRREARTSTATEMELAPPVFDLDDDEQIVRVAAVAKPSVPVRGVWTVGCAEVASAAAKVLGVDCGAVRSRSRQRTLAQARRVALIVWVRVMNRPAVEMSAYLGISTAAASALVNREGAARIEAARLVEEVARILDLEESESEKVRSVPFAESR
jgi:hypothetical protein